jgi:hypothetical protein
MGKETSTGERQNAREARRIERLERITKRDFDSQTKKLKDVPDGSLSVNAPEAKQGAKEARRSHRQGRVINRVPDELDESNEDSNGNAAVTPAAFAFVLSDGSLLVNAPDGQQGAKSRQPIHKHKETAERLSSLVNDRSLEIDEDLTPMMGGEYSAPGDVNLTRRIGDDEVVKIEELEANNSVVVPNVVPPTSPNGAINDVDMMDEMMGGAYSAPGDEFVSSAAIVSVPRGSTTAELHRNEPLVPPVGYSLNNVRGARNIRPSQLPGAYTAQGRPIGTRPSFFGRISTHLAAPFRQGTRRRTTATEDYHPDLVVAAEISPDTADLEAQVEKLKREAIEIKKQLILQDVTAAEVVEERKEQPPSRRRFVWILLGLLIIVGVVVGPALALGGKDGDPPTMTPGNWEDFFELVGRPLDGPNVTEMYGASISLSRDGKRMVTADLQGVQIFDHLDETPQDSEEEGDWVQLTVIPAPGKNLGGGISSNDMIRASVVVDISRDGRYVAIGTPFASGGDNDTNDDQPTNIGRVEVYGEEPSSIQWERRGNIIFGEAAEEFFGSSVSLSGDGGVLAVGVGGTGNGELVRVYMLDDGIWIPRGGKINIGGMLFLGSVSLSADGLVLAVGGIPTNDDENPAVVRIFLLKSGEWLELGEGVNGRVEETAYQAALSGDGTIVAVSNYYVGPVGSAQAESNDALDARALEWSPDHKQWIPLGENLHASAPGPKSGYFISLSDDGTIIAMSDPGTPNQYGGVTGHAHIFKYDGDSWMQLGPNKNGEAPGDQFGFDVSISGDGRYFAVGAPFNRGSGLERGRVYVYALGE